MKGRSPSGGLARADARIRLAQRDATALTPARRRDAGLTAAKRCLCRPSRRITYSYERWALRADIRTISSIILRYI